MMGLLVFKEKLKQFYAKYSLYLIPVIKFAVGFLAFYLINTNVGFMTRINRPVVAVVMGLVASFVPYGATAFFAGCFVVAHISQVSLEVALILAAFILIVMVLYYGFRPGDGWLLLLTPMMFFLNIPYVVPLIAGLAGGIVTVVPVSCGVCFYYILMYLKQNAGILAGGTMSEMTSRFLLIVKSVFGNELMWVMIAAFAAAILMVFLVKNLSVDFSWSIAIVAGVITQLVVIFIGDFQFNLPITVSTMVIGIVISVLIALVYQFFAFAVDYSRTEFLQYEDDDYYYYVKAVPKIAVATPDVKVHRIYSRKSNRREKNE